MSTHTTGSEVALRDVAAGDLPIFFEQQRDPVAVHMAAFTAADPSDHAAFQAHWDKILGDTTLVKQTILCGGQVAGNILHFEMFGEPMVGYWVGRDYWGRGVATAALTAFLRQVLARPLYARVASDNLASRRVLEKCGFAVVGADRGFANARGTEIDELILRLDARAGDEAR